MANTSGANAPGGPGYPTTFATGAKRLDAGGRSNPITLPMLAVGLRQVLEWTPHRIQATLAPFVRRIAAAATTDMGLVCPPTAGHFIGLYFPHDQQEDNGAAEERNGGNREGSGPAGTVYSQQLPRHVAMMVRVHEFLKLRAVHCSVRSGALRVSPHLYTTEEEVDAFLVLLGQAVEVTRVEFASR